MTQLIKHRPQRLRFLTANAARRGDSAVFVWNLTSWHRKIANAI